MLKGEKEDKKNKEMSEEKTWQENLKEAEEQGGGEIEAYADVLLNPVNNPKVITIMQMSDGNFKCWGQRNGKMHQTRGVKPEDCLMELLTKG